MEADCRVHLSTAAALALRHSSRNLNRRSATTLLVWGSRSARTLRRKAGPCHWLSLPCGHSARPAGPLPQVLSSSSCFLACSSVVSSFITSAAAMSHISSACQLYIPVEDSDICSDAILDRLPHKCSEDIIFCLHVLQAAQRHSNCGHSMWLFIPKKSYQATAHVADRDTAFWNLLSKTRRPACNAFFWNEVRLHQGPGA